LIFRLSTASCPLMPHAYGARLAGREAVIHAGEIGRPEIPRSSPASASIAPVTADQGGNVDTDEWGRVYLRTTTPFKRGVLLHHICTTSMTSRPIPARAERNRNFRPLGTAAHRNRLMACSISIPKRGPRRSADRSRWRSWANEAVSGIIHELLPNADAQSHGSASVRLMSLQGSRDHEALEPCPAVACKVMSGVGKIIGRWRLPTSLGNTRYPGRLVRARPRWSFRPESAK